MTKAVARNPSFPTLSGEPYISAQNTINVVQAVDDLVKLRIGTPTVAANPNIVTANMSFGISPSSTSTPWNLNECRNSDFPLRAAIEVLASSGVVVVAAAGNRFREPSGQLVDYGMAYPACDPVVLSVASTNKQSQPVNFSVYGYLADPGMSPAYPPSILAPGGIDLVQGVSEDPAPCTDTIALNSRICSTKANVAAAQNLREERSGTSMSAPVIAGAIARVRNRFPNMSGAQAGQALIASGRTVQVPERNTTMPEVSLENTFKYITLPQNVQSSGCRLLSWSAPRHQIATGYKVRTASTAAGLATAPIIDVGNVLSASFPQNGIAEVSAYDAQTGLLAETVEWSEDVVLSSGSCVPTLAPTPQVVGTPFQCGDTTFLNCRTVSWNSVPSSNGVQFQGSASTDFSAATTSSSTQNSASFFYGYMRLRACNNSDCGPWSAPLLVDGNLGQ
ncbi:S8 family serine peptidase [bacterium]|nr:S8 family serine peptidase [bacterium]